MTEKVVNPSATPSECQARRVARSSLQQQSDNATVLAIDGAAASPWPYCFVQHNPEDLQALPRIGFSQTGNPAESDGAFDDAGIPVGKGWDEFAFPAIDDENTYAIEVAGNSLDPTYRDGTVLIVSPNASIRRRDRVVVKTKDGKVTVSELKRRTSKIIELRSLGSEPAERTVSLRDVLWMQRVVWASQ